VVDELAQDSQECYVPNQYSDKPVKNEAEIAKILLDVESKTAVRRKIVPIFDREGKRTGYQIADVPNTFTEMINRDMVKSNLNIVDLRVVRQIGILGSYVQSISCANGANYEEFQKFLADIGAHWIDSGRARDGWAAALSKTDKSIMENTLKNIQQQNQEKKKSRWRFW